MAAQDRDDQGRFGSKLTEQDVLKAFDFEATADDPYLTVTEIQNALAEHWNIDVSDETVRLRLEAMVEEEQVGRREFGPSVAYRALVGPRLRPQLAAELEETREKEWENATPLDELDFESGA